MMLNLKELIAKMLGVEVTYPAVADFITPGTNWTIVSNRIKVCQFGRLKLLSWVGKYTGAWADGVQSTMGTLATAYRPSIETVITSIQTTGVIAPNGTVYVKNVTGGNLQNAETTYCAVIIN